MPAEFDRYAAEYEELLRDPIRDGFAGDSRFYHERKWDLIRSFLDRRKQDTARMRWLDVGCGKGELLRMGGDRFGHAIGCDPAREMAAGSQVETVHQPDVTKLPFASSEFDFVTAVCVFHHVEPVSRCALVQEMARVLRPGGVVCLMEHNPWNPVTRLIVSRTPVDADAILLSSGEVVQMLRQARFGVLDKRYFLYLPRKLYRLAGGLEGLLAKAPAGGQYAVFAERLP
ncbi:MAG: class I SAM-dependent methyltransferase [Acidobacteriota bacterium]